jgi:hypothetical protein
MHFTIHWLFSFRTSVRDVTQFLQLVFITSETYAKWVSAHWLHTSTGAVIWHCPYIKIPLIGAAPGCWIDRTLYSKLFESDLIFFFMRPLHKIGTDDVNRPTSLCGEEGSVPGQATWRLWYPNWHWDKFLPHKSDFSCLSHSTKAQYSFTHLRPKLYNSSNLQRR